MHRFMWKYWLLFCQSVTVALAALFVLGIFRPEFLAGYGGAAGHVTIREAPTSATVSANPASFRNAANKAMPSVVNIFTSKDVRASRHPLLTDPLFRRFFGEQFEEDHQRSSSLGSGVIVGAEGFILTNHHVIEAADEIDVALTDGRKLRAKLVGTDPETDLAVLRVEGGELPSVTFGQAETMQVGDVVLAIGNPFGVGQTVTMGIVSALGRSHLGINTFENFIQTDAAINPGNSGGALVDSSGNLVGINSAIYSRSGGSMGIGFAIPVSLVRQVMEQIIVSGTVVRGWIGVEVQELTVELAESFKMESTDGTLIAGVLRNGPADKAGIKPGDILTGVNGTPVGDSSSMLNLVAALQPGKNAQIQVMRSGKKIELPVTVGRRPAAARRNHED
jgi:serine protease DegQ